MISVFFSLPDHLKISLLDEWLALPNTEWTTSDRVGDDLFAAVELCHRYRKELSELLGSPECIFQCHVDDIDGDKLPIIGKYGMKVRNLTLYRNCYEKMESGPAVLRFLSPYLRDLAFNLVSQSDIENTRHLIPIQVEIFDNNGISEYNYGYDYVGGDAILCEIFDACPLLEHFRLDRFLVDGVTLSVRLHDSFCQLFTKCANLQGLHLNGCKNISADVVLAMCTAPNLTYISLTCFCTFAADAFDNVNSSSTANSRVRHIESSCVQFSALFPPLHTINMFEHNSTEAVLLARSCPNITTATLGLSDTLSTAEATQLSMYWHNIRTMSLNNSGQGHEPISADAIQVLITQLRLLQIIYISEHYRGSYPTNFIAVPACKYPLHYQGSKLRELYINCATHELLNTIVHVCPYLHTLYLFRGSEGLVSVEERLLDSLHVLNSSSVQCLCIEGYTTLSDTHISALCTLEILALNRVRSKALTNAGIVNMAKSSASLRELHVDNVSGVTANVGLDVVQVCPTLHTYMFSNCITMIPGHKNDSNVDMCMHMVRTLLRVAYPHVRTFSVCVTNPKE